MGKWPVQFLHSSYDEHQRRLDQLVALREELHLPVAAMLDTKGPEVRLRSFQNGPVQLKTGQSFCWRPPNGRSGAGWRTTA